MRDHVREVFLSAAGCCERRWLPRPFPTTKPKLFISFGMTIGGCWELTYRSSSGSVLWLQFRRGPWLLGEVCIFSGEGGVEPAVYPVAYGGKTKRRPRGNHGRKPTIVDAMLWVEDRLTRAWREQGGDLFAAPSA